MPVPARIQEFATLVGYGALAGRASRYATQARFARWTERVSGGLIVAAAASVASVRRI